MFLTALLSLAACDVPQKSIGDDDGDGDGDSGSSETGDGDTTDTGDGDGGPVDCEAACGNVSRECEFDACCACATGGGQMLILDSFPPQYACETGNGPDFEWEPPDCSWGECADHVTVLAVDEVFAPVGVTPQEVIDTIGASMVAPHEWDQSELRLNVLASTTEVTFTAIPTGDFRGIERTWVAPEDLPNLEGSCPSTVQVDVDVTLTTADGALDEDFAAVVQTSGDANIDLVPPSVTLNHSFPVHTFNGSLELSADNPESTTIGDPDLLVQFGRIGEGVDPEARSGSLTTGVETITEEFASFTWAEFGRWGTGG